MKRKTEQDERNSVLPLDKSINNDDEKVLSRALYRYGYS